jgi:putative tricarboxylic transport membrane protein
MFAGFGLFAAVYAGMHHELGTAVRMGPGYFPAVLGGVLLVLGGVVLIRSLAFDGPSIEAMRLRPVAAIIASCVGFAYMLASLGLVVTTLLLVVVSSLGGREFRGREVAALAGALVLFSVAVFVKGLELPYPLWPALLL